MSKEQYQEMLDIRKRLNLYETSMAAGYDVDAEEYNGLLDEFKVYVAEYEDDTVLMTEEEAEIFRLRYVLGFSFHAIMCTMYKNARSESTARKKIERFFQKGLV